MFRSVNQPKDRRGRRIIVVRAALIVFMAAASGCVASTSVYLDETGVQISEETLERIVPGKTTEAWLLATLGPPHERTVLESEGITILRYDHTITRTESGAIFLILTSETRTINTEHTYFEIKDGIVISVRSEL